MILDREHRILRVNKAMERKLSRTATDLMGRSCHHMVHGINEPIEGCPHVSLLAGGFALRSELVMEYLDGVYRISVSPLMDHRGFPWGVLHVARDIAELKKTEHELKRTQDELDQRIRERTIELVQLNKRL